MKKKLSIVILFSVLSMFMTAFSMSDKFLSVSYLIKSGLALFFIFVAILLLIVELVKQNKNKTNK